MRYLSIFVLIGLLVGCAGSPPKPPECEGEFHPLNIQQLEQGAKTMTRSESIALCGKGGRHVG